MSGPSKQSESSRTDIAVIKTDIGYIKKQLDHIDSQVSSTLVTQQEFRPIKMIVYGLVALLLADIVTRILEVTNK